MVGNQISCLFAWPWTEPCVGFGQLGPWLRVAINWWLRSRSRLGTDWVSSVITSVLSEHGQIDDDDDDDLCEIGPIESMWPLSQAKQTSTPKKPNVFYMFLFAFQSPNKKGNNPPSLHRAYSSFTIHTRKKPLFLWSIKIQFQIFVKTLFRLFRNLWVFTWNFL